MLVPAEMVWFPSGDQVTYVMCAREINFFEEQIIRKILDNYYKKKRPNFSKLAFEINGKMISFRPIRCPNKQPPNKEEVIMVLKAIDCYPREKMTLKKNAMREIA